MQGEKPSSILSDKICMSQDKGEIEPTDVNITLAARVCGLALHPHIYKEIILFTGPWHLPQGPKI